MAPTRWHHWLSRAFVWLVAVNVLVWLVQDRILRLPYVFEESAQIIALVSLPVIWLLLMAFRHQKALQDRLALLATTDALTGLPNRRAFLEAAATGGGGALLLLDADHFKRVNDAHGHAVGDACLRALADHLRRHLRKGDLVGRLGGEEFALFLPGATRAEAEALGARLCREVAVEAGSAPPLRLTLSAGAALGTPDLPLDRLMAQADAALYQAKEAGRARLVVCREG